jgi:hypothetical protein
MAYGPIFLSSSQEDHTTNPPYLSFKQMGLDYMEEYISEDSMKYFKAHEDNIKYQNSLQNQLLNNNKNDNNKFMKKNKFLNEDIELKENFQED